ncbi:MAG: hypothetical protein ACTSPI_06745 [Candidatus Heimdallarchaeaceae archaeon]
MNKEDLTQDKKIASIEKHVNIMNTEMGQLRDKMGSMNKDIQGVKIQVTKIATNLEWLTKLIFPIFMTILLGFLGALIKLVLK